MSIAFEVDMETPFAETVERVSEALKIEGFGILTRADLDTAFRERLGHEFRPYTILGACNPALALRALTAHPEVGLFLPCNVTVEAADDGRSRVRFLDPDAIMGQAEFGEDPEMVAVAREARERIERVALSLGKERP